MLGESRNPWAGSPWADELAFRTDFDSAVEKNPVWAQEIIAASYSRPCRLQLKALQGGEQKPPPNKPVKVDKVDP